MKRLVLLIAVAALAASPLPSLAAKPKTSAICKAAGTRMRCHAIVVDGANGQPLASGAPLGYGPDVFRSVYQVSVHAQTLRLGLVVAYHNASLATDLAAFSRQYGLPSLPTCTSAGQIACLDVRDTAGGHNYPAADSGWALEETLDTESTHGLCPTCRLEVVEAPSPAMADLGAAEDEAVNLGAQVVSNSWGGSETKKEAAFDTHFARTGVAFVFSSGDNGYHTSYPAASPAVLAVGGTSLTITGSQHTETAWKSSGSGCSRYEAKPTWQTDNGCSGRMIADLAADADPATGAAVYHAGHWYEVGGTSLAAPLVAAMMAASDAVIQPATIYRRVAGATNDVTAGHTSTCGTYLCTAGAGYDGPTGWGSPIASRLF